jgi:hypothetical protein
MIFLIYNFLLRKSHRPMQFQAESLPLSQPQRYPLNQPTTAKILEGPILRYKDSSTQACSPTETADQRMGRVKERKMTIVRSVSFGWWRRLNNWNCRSWKMSFIIC